MKIHACSIEELVKSYWDSVNTGEKISANQAKTIVSIIEAFMVLMNRKGASIDKINVKDLAMKAGYSRTTFYVHFYDLYDVKHKLCEMMLHHMSINAEVYYQLFWDALPDDVVKDVYEMLDYYGKYILLLLRDFEFTQKYKEKFISLIVRGAEQDGDIQKTYYSRICASAMIESYLFWLEYQGKIPYRVIVKTVNMITTATVYNDTTIW